MLCPSCGKTVESGLVYCTFCASKLPQTVESESIQFSSPEIAPLNRKGMLLRFIGTIAVLIVLIVLSTALSRRFGLAMAQNAASALLALLVGYFVQPKARRQRMSNASYFSTFSAYIFVVTILHEVVVPSGQSVPAERQGIFLLLEIAAAYGSYYFALRKA